MKIRFISLVFGLTALCVWPIAGQQVTDPEVLFQAALHHEQVELKLELAIAGYTDVVAKAGSNRTIAAKALLQMAGCYERLGKPEAHATYEAIVKDYSNSGRVVEAARARLAAMDQKGTGLVARQVWDSTGDAVTADGRYVVFMNYKDDLAVHDLVTGKDRLLTTEGTGVDGYSDFAQPSPDSKLIAYNWIGLPFDGQLFVIGIDGGNRRMIYQSKESEYVVPIGWAPDNKSVLVTIRRRGLATPTTDLTFIPVSGNAHRLIKRFEGPAPNRSGFSISPDGRYIAYNRPAVAGRPEHNLYSIDVSTGAELPMLASPADDRMLDWFPESNRILFVSDRGGTQSIWSASVAGGRVQGEPIVIRRGTGRINSHGMTDRGEFYYATGDLSAPGASQYEVYLPTLDSRPKSSSAELSRLEGRYTGYKTQAAWSTDGTRIAYVQLPAQATAAPSTTQTLSIQTIATGEVHELTLKMQRIQNPVWLPDGRGVIVQGTDLRPQQGLFKIDTETGAITFITDNADFPGVSSDGTRVIFRHAATAAGVPSSIVARDLSSGLETVLIVNNEGDVSHIELSPDGQLITATRGGDRQPTRVVIMPSVGGKFRVLPVPAGWRILPSVTFAADSRSVLVVKDGARGEVWQVPVDGTAPRNTGISWPGEIRRIAASPDGRRLAMSTSVYLSELWVLQNIPAQGRK